MTLLDSIRAFVADRVSAERLNFHVSCRDSLDTADVVRAKCTSYAKAVAAAFPGVTAVAGFYGVAASAGRRRPGVEHWWCSLPDGTIYDPTVEQFEKFYGIAPSEGVYILYQESYHHVYKGRCMACGAEHHMLASQSFGGICPGSQECVDIMERE